MSDVDPHADAVRRAGESGEAAGEGELAFFGTLTASLSHQMNNVFTIINEINGLLEDQLYLLDQGRELSPETLQRVAEKTERNVRRGTAYVACLNKLAHMTDQPRAAVSLVTWLSLAGDLLRRFAELRQSTLEVALPGEDLTVTTSPFLLLQVVFRCLEAVLSGASPELTVTLRARAVDDRIALVVAASRPLANPADGSAVQRRTHSLVARLGGELVLAAGETGFEFRLWLPRNPAAEPPVGVTVN